jgi:lipopolysaccharide export system protein LptC
MAHSVSWQVAPADRGVRLRAFAAARRHSRLVRVLRVLLPVMGVVTVAGFVVVAHLRLPAGFDVAAARLSVTRDGIVMDRPHLTGFDREHREYTLAADRAVQPFTNPGEVRLERIDASVESAAGAITMIRADSGNYNQTKNTLNLSGAIKVDSADGYFLRLDDAEIDFSASTLQSKNPVTVGYGESRTTGNRLSVTDGGKLIVIDGDVHTTVIPPKRKAEPSPAESE